MAQFVSLVFKMSATEVVSVGIELTLRLLMSYIYMELLAKPEMLTSYIQGVPGGKDLTSGECSLGQTIPI